MSRRLVLHVGSHKTGTTTIQRELARHRGALESIGVRYSAAFEGHLTNHSVPMVSMFASDPTEIRAHRYLGHSLAAIEQANVQFRTDLVDDISRGDYDTYVLSGEEISSLKGESLTALREFLSQWFDEIVVVYCVREPGALITSIEQQLLRSGGGRSEAFRPASVAARYRTPFRLSEEFGRDAVNVYRMEDAAKVGVVSYFVRAFLGVDPEWIEDPLYHSGLSAYGAALLRVWSRAVPNERPGWFTRRVARPARGLMAHVPGPAYRPRATLDAAGCGRINEAAAALAEEFSLQPYAPITPRG